MASFSKAAFNPEENLWFHHFHEHRFPARLALSFQLYHLGMARIGYQAGIAGSKRSLTKLVLALAFSLVISLIASLDRPQGGIIKVSQQPLIDPCTP